MAALLAGAVVAGIAIGVLSGMLGIGGGIIMVPLFRLVFGLSPVGSTATSLFAIIPTSVSGAVTHVRAKTCIPLLGVAMGIGGACTSPAGAWLANASPGWAVMLASAIVIGYSAATMLRKALKPAPAAQEQTNRGRGLQAPGLQATGAQVPGAWKQDALERGRGPHDLPPAAAPATTPATLAKAAGIGAAAGLASGYIGLGGGFLMVPLMISLLGMPMKKASGTSLVAVMILAVPATVVQCLLGNVDFLVGIAVACGSIPGAMAGARLAARAPERTLRLLFAGFLGAAAVLLAANEFALLGPQ